MEILKEDFETNYKIAAPKIWSEHDLLNEPIAHGYPIDIEESLTTQLKDLNKTKTGLDVYNTSPENFDKIIRNFDFYGGLRKYYQSEKGAQIVTNAWLKCYEIISDYGLMGRKRQVKVFYNAELPGAFISATNHYCKTHDIDFRWMASSYYPEQSEREGLTVLEDRYNLYANYRSQWIMDRNMNGDLTVPENILEIQSRVLKKFPRGVDCYFSDAGVDVGEEYHLQEELNALLNLGQVVSGLTVVAPGGSFCTKQYTLSNPLNMSIALLLSNMFREFYIIKPRTSRPTNSEVYLLGKGYYGMIPSIQNRLLEIMKSLKSVKDPWNYSFYEDSDRIRPNLDRLVSVSRSLFIQGQKRLLDTILDLLDQNRDQLDLFFKSLKPIHDEKMDNYIYQYNIRRLDGRDRLDTRPPAGQMRTEKRKNTNRDFEPEFDYSRANGELFGKLFLNIGVNMDYMTFLHTLNKGFKNISGFKDWKIRDNLLYQIKKKVSEGLSDKEVYQFIHQYMVDNVYKVFGFPQNQGKDRGNVRAGQIDEILYALQFKPETILDFGSGEGTITKALANRLKLSTDSVISIDIKQPKDTSGFTFIKARPDFKIPLKDDSVDLVTCLMVLHHLDDPIKTLLEFYRVLAPGGYLILREHDVYKIKGYFDPNVLFDASDQIDILHGFYEGVWGETSELENPEHPDGYFSHYRQKEDWTNLIESVGFEHVYDNTDKLIFKNYDRARIMRTYIVGQKIKNPYYGYFAVYRKPIISNIEGEFAPSSPDYPPPPN